MSHRSTTVRPLRKRCARAAPTWDWARSIEAVLWPATGARITRQGLEEQRLTSGKVPLEKTMRRQVLPHAPSPTMTSLRLISDIAVRV